MRNRIIGVTVAFLLYGLPGNAQTPVTFNKEVVRIFQQHCQSCHRPENIAPFSLLTYAEARPHAIEIKNAVESHVMPPWKPVGSHGVFEDERFLTDEEIQTLSQWVADGVPEGDPADLPPAIVFPESWTAGVPEMALQNSEPFAPPSGSDDVYRCFTIPLESESDLYVRGYEVLPGNRKIVHHVILFTDATGASVPLDDADPGPGYTCFGGPGFSQGVGGFGGWAPGASAQMFPAGNGVRIKAGSRLVVQVHYSLHDLVSSGEAIEPDLTRVGLYLSPTPLERIWVLPIINTSFTIPPGNSHYRVGAIMPVLQPIEVYSIAPHMHLLGKQVTVEAWLPFLQRRQLIRIDDWEFHWQASYNYKQPIKLPAGTLLVMTAYFDNSTNNPNNPSNPPVPVRFGERTVDEMAITFLLVKGGAAGGDDLTGTAPQPEHTGGDQPSQ